MKKCPYCAEEIQDDAIVCRYCGRDLEKSTSVPRRPSSPVSEVTYYDSHNVTITSSRAILGSNTYSMANITSVSTHSAAANKLPGIVVVFVGFITGMCLTVQFSESGLSQTAAILLAVAIGGAIAALGVYVYVSAKPTYTVRIGSASGGVNALTSTDQEFIKNIVVAINKAIVERG